MTETASADHTVTTLAALEALYDAPGEASILKEIDHVNTPYRALIEAAPFVVIATGGAGGLDCSPRGDPAGFVRVVDARTLLIPDRRGNNRIDTLRNLIEDPRIALLFVVPGCDETLRVNGRATISTDPALTESFRLDGKAPRTVLVVSVERVYFQCSKALVRSRLWDPERRVDRRTLPSAGEILAACSRGRIAAEPYDTAYPDRLKATLY